MWIERDGDLVCGEVELAARAEDPAAFDARGFGFVAFAVGEDEHAVPLASVLRVVGEPGGSVEVCAAGPDAFDVGCRAAAPFDDVLVCDGVVEGEDGDRGLLRQVGEFAEESGEHFVRDAA